MFRSLPSPFQRAAFMMFLVSEVHPFDDGNGRLTRAMMNAELISGGERRILIATAYREDYLLALRALSRQRNPQPFLKMLERAQRFSAAIDFSDLQGALASLRACHAFESGEDARLRMPD
jgi:Fic family protein